MKMLFALRSARSFSGRRSFLSGFAVLSVMATSLTACSSGANPAFYTLAVTPGQPLSGGPRYVEVRLPTIASGLDRDRIVTADSGYRLTLSQNDAWSDSLSAQISHALAGDIAQRLPGSAVFAENDAVSTQPDAYVELSVTHFSRGPSGRTQLEAILSVRAIDTNQPFYMQRLTLEGKAPSSSAALIQDMSLLLGQLSDTAATQLRMLQADQASRQVTSQ
ncbi:MULTISPECIES: PqiC family protein [Acetobacter]|uniref:PqiC family protein n=1 Tax=Acetobacter TaxID=434 RepID=UPI000A3820F7|nr:MULTISPECIES: PqiC family protein [Acetobacter]MBS0980863.1 membrane integrity-associated transporter subunit PqiC [Acetobacter thailandicus]OUI89118.1 hypothetical protein HK11_02435 [Acetobacter sp. DmW_043]